MNMTVQDIRELLNDPDRPRFEELARRAAEMTRRHFGRAMVLYAPLYLSNFCSSYCTYCGFHSHNRIRRIKLTPDQIRCEMQAIASTGIENILLLTGESYKATPLSYLLDAVRTAGQYFTNVSLEVHPMETEEYRQLYLGGVDGITVYQETYDRDRYREVHISGQKSDYDYRYNTPERAALSGMRHLSMGILLGLSEPAADLFELYRHLRFMERRYPGVEYSLSFPRLRTIKGREFAVCDVDDAWFIKIICLTRVLFPRVGINLSTRETCFMRDHALELGITRMSAGSNTAVGGYSVNPRDEQDPQFDIEDTRPVGEIIRMLKEKNFDPVLTDWRPIHNETLK